EGAKTVLGHSPNLPCVGDVRCKRAPDAPNLRRIFNCPKAYEGLGPDRDEDTRKMLSKLALRMRSGSPGWVEDDNGPIPSGYTYLAQLVAHDFVQNSAPLTPLGDFRQPLQ